MISVQIDASALANLRARLANLAPQIVISLEEKLTPLLKSALPATLSRHFAGSGPKGGPSSALLTSRSGNLFNSVVNSLSVSVHGSGLVIGIGSPLPYAAIQEFGGIAGRRGPFKKKNGRRPYISPRPYLRPAVNDLQQILPDLLDQAISQLEGSHDLFT